MMQFALVYLRRGAWLALGMATIVMWNGTAGAAQTQRYGKALLVEHRVPDDMIKEFNRFKPSEPAKGESVIVNTLLADTKDWAGPAVDGRTSGNPYTIAVIVKGVAKADGDAATMWQAGWRIEDKNGDGTRLIPLPGIAKPGAKAGENVEIMGAATPTTFKEDRKAAPMIGLVNARNLEIKEVKVQVWSGMADPTWVESVLSFRWALIGVVLVALWWFGFRRT